MSSLLHFLCNLLGGLFLFLGSLHVSLAHNGEDHAHETVGAEAVPTLPNAETESEQFELVVQADPVKKILLFYLDDFQTNAPVSHATLEIETGQFRALAQEKEKGVYLLNAPFLHLAGDYPLTVTITAGQISDLLALTVKIPQKNHQKIQQEEWPILAWSQIGLFFMLGVGVGGGIFLLLQRRPFHSAKIILPLFLSSSFCLMVGSFPQEGHAFELSKSLFVEKATQRFLGVRTQQIALENIAKTITLQATVVADPNQSGKIQANQSGSLTLSGKPLYIGQTVRKNQIVAVLHPTLTALEKSTQSVQLADLKQQIALTEQKLSRYRQIPEVIPQKEITNAQLELQGLRARVAATARAFQQTETLRIPITGTITTLNMTHGQVVNAGEVLLEITAPQGLLIEALQFESPAFSQFETASLTYQGKTIPLVFLGKSLKRREQSQPLLFGLKKIESLPVLQMGQPLSIVVTLKEKQRGYRLPQSSLAKNKENEDIVFVHEHAQLFRPFRVMSQPLENNMIFIPENWLHPQDRVVVQGAAALAQKN